MALVSMPTTIDTRSIRRELPVAVATGALIATVACVAFASLLMEPLNGLAGQTGAGISGAFVAFALLAPLGWMIFATAVWSTLKDRALPRQFGFVMRSVAASVVPWIVLTLAGTLWTAGPQESMLILATLSVPAGAVAAIVAAAQYR